MPKLVYKCDLSLFLVVQYLRCAEDNSLLVKLITFLPHTVADLSVAPIVLEEASLSRMYMPAEFGKFRIAELIRASLRFKS